MKLVKLTTICLIMVIASCRNAGLEVPVSSITIQGDNISDGGSSQLTATVLPENAAVKAVGWSVSDASVATIDEFGVLMAVSNGQVVVTAKAQDDSGVEGKRSFTVSGVGAEDNAEKEAPEEGEEEYEFEYDSALGGVQVSTWEEIMLAISSAQPGDTIYISGRDYVFNFTINISKSGDASSGIKLLANPNDDTRPKFDFSNQSERSSNRGINLKGSYWHIKGIDIYGAGDNGLNISGSNNTIEFCSFYENADSGLQIDGGGSNNTIINCDSYFNADASKENADGFACKLDAGTGNKFIGCRAWQNLDDGWDGYLRGTDNIKTTFENCWAFKNGYLKDGTVGAGDGNGFKTGGSDNKELKHFAEYRNCIAAGNTHDGFDHNSNRGDVLIYNSAAHANGRNISFSSTNPVASLTIKNTLSFGGGSNDSFNGTTTDVTNNSWQNGLEVSFADFESVDMSLLSSPRKADGSLPDIDYLKLVTGSDLIDAGTDVGLEYQGAAPDLGAFELQ